MLDAAATLCAGVLFGLALAAPPGPMNAVIAEESVLRGFRAGARAGLGAATADACFFLLALAGAVAFVRRLPVLRGLMVGVGGLLMLRFAYGAATGARRSFDPAGEERPGGGAGGGGPGDATDGVAPDGGGRGFRKAFVLALTNPYQVLFWLTVGVGLLEPGTVDVLAHVSESLAGLLVVRTGSPALLVGVFGGIGVWITAFPAALVAGERRVAALGPAVAVASAAVLAGFGVYFLVDAAGTLAGTL